MANAAAKKAVKAGQAASSKLIFFILGSIGFFLAYRCYYKRDSLSWLHWVLFLVHLIGLAIGYFGIVEAAKNNTTANVYVDILGTVILSQIVSCFSDYGWAVLLIIPAYAAFYFFGPKAASAAKKAIDEAGEEEDEAGGADVGKAGKEKKKVKYVRAR